MPIYEYKCGSCELQFALIKPIGEQPATVRCEKENCKGRAMRVPSVPAPAHFKGAGFYATDYKSTSPNP